MAGKEEKAMPLFVKFIIWISVGILYILQTYPVIYRGDWAAWLFSILGYFLIVYLMVSGARRLEIRQKKNCGSDPKYQEYIKKTPICNASHPGKIPRKLDMAEVIGSSLHLSKLQERVSFFRESMLFFRLSSS